MSAVKFGVGVASFFPMITGVRQGLLVLSLFNTCMDWLLGRVMDQSHCGASVSTIEITDLVLPMMQ